MTNSSKAISYLFARWLAMNYADEKEGGLSVLNTKNGYWYKERFEYFENNVYPHMKKNGSLSEAMSLFNDTTLFLQ